MKHRIIAVVTALTLASGLGLGVVTTANAATVPHCTVRVYGPVTPNYLCPLQA